MVLNDTIDDVDLTAYIDNQLDAPQRIAVEAYLSTQPEIAAQVMSDLRARDELRLAMASWPTTATPGTDNAAKRLDSALGRRNWFARIRPLAAAGILLAAGWFAHAQFGFPTAIPAASAVPEYVDVAIEAHRTSLLRATMYSQLEAPEYDRDELLSGTAIAMPDLPRGWDVTDVQVYPSKFGPSVEMAILAGQLGTVSLFAARPGHSEIAPVTAEHVGDVTTAHWQVGEVAFALVGRVDIDPLREAAIDLSETQPIHPDLSPAQE